jgi:hypothetical protein
MQSLSTKVKVKRRFQKAVRVDSDLNTAQALDGYVCSPSAAQVLKHLAAQIAETGQGAFTWTGPYGGGKSSLALALASLLGVDPDRRAAARVAIGARVADQILARIGGQRTIIPIVGRRADAEAVILDHIHSVRTQSTGHRYDALKALHAAAEQSGGRLQR